jgi:hypothetical protein
LVNPTPAALADAAGQRHLALEQQLAELDQWATPRPVTPEVFGAAWVQPTYRVQFQSGSLVRIHLPAFASGYQPSVYSNIPEDPRLADWRRRLAQPARPRRPDDLSGVILEGLIAEPPSGLEFIVQDLLLYRDRWLLDQPWYVRRTLLEQVFAEASASGQAQRGHWSSLSFVLTPSPLVWDDEPWALYRMDATYGIDDDQRPLSCREFSLPSGSLTDAATPVQSSGSS